MRTIERDALLFLLAAAAGSADSWSYFGLGHAFVANMTGNTVLVGLAVFQPHGDLLHPLISLCCYAAGAGTASALTRKTHPASLWSRAISWTLFLEAVLMASAEAGWITIHLRALHPANVAGFPVLDLLLGGVAFATGLQSGAMLQLKIPGIVTTYITGTWTNLMNGLVHFTMRERRPSRKQELELKERLGMQAGILAVYFFAAVMTSWLSRHATLGVGALSAGSVISVAMYSIFRIRDWREPTTAQTAI